MGKIDPALKKLHQWFTRNARELPWRNDPSPYRVWISEIMLQQTQVATVMPYFERFVKEVPNVETLAAVEDEDLMRLWAGLGYYSRARNLKKAAVQIVTSLAGQLPETRDEWLELPGVGPYTAGAIASIAYNQCHPILDGNIERVLARLQLIPRDSKMKEKMWALSDQYVREAHQLKLQPSQMNQAWMELGAVICKPKSPRCKDCPLQSVCKAYKNDRVGEFPQKKPKKNWKKIEETLDCVVNRLDCVLLEKAGEGEWRSGLWDFVKDVPRSKKLELIGEYHSKHVVTNHKIQRTTRVWRLSDSGKSLLKSGRSWVDRNEVSQLPTGSAFKKSYRGVQPLLFSDSSDE